MNKTFYQNQIDNLEADVRRLSEQIENLERQIEHFKRILDLNGVVVSDCADRPIYLYNHKKQT